MKSICFLFALSSIGIASSNASGDREQFLRRTKGGGRAKPTASPTPLPTVHHTTQATEKSYCDCPACTSTIWNALAGQYSCGARISWLMSGEGGGYSEYDACVRVAGVEFGNGPCGPQCNPEVCTGTPVPTTGPTAKPTTANPTLSPTPPPTVQPTPLPSASPSMKPTEEPTTSPTKKPTEEPTTSPINKPTEQPATSSTDNPTPNPTDLATSPPTEKNYCGCPACTETIWNTLAGQYSCGARISWMMSGDGGGYSEYDACVRVAGIEYGNGPCGPQCNPEVCNSPPPTPKPTLSETSSPTHQTFCSCSECTTDIWNSPATDVTGQSYTCGARISYLMSAVGGSYSERDSCIRVSGKEFADGPCGPKCNPILCNPEYLEEPDPATLIWNDEFDVDGSPDPTKWDYDLGDGCHIGICGWGNNEQQYYTSNQNNVKIENGVLQLLAKVTPGYPLPYTSSRMVSRGKQSFKYGRIQFRARLANCTALGSWPALWMLPSTDTYGNWPNGGEIDVMETVGHEVETFFGTVHTLSSNQAGSPDGSQLNKSKSEWHIFEMEWRENNIKFAIDGQIYHQYDKNGAGWESWPFDQEFHLLMNVAVGGPWAGRYGIDAASFEGAGQVMEVDWVRVYE